MSFTLTFSPALNTATYPTLTVSGCTFTTSDNGVTYMTPTNPASLTGFNRGPYASNLVSVTNIPSSVTSIGTSAFSNCSSLTSITIPSTVTSIGSSAFASCTSLPTINIPASVNSIGTGSFQSCTRLTSIVVDSNNTGFTNNNGDGNLYSCTKNGGVTTLISLIQYAVGKTATSFTIPNGVIFIGNAAFQNCTSLTNITIPSTVTSIGSSAFARCTLLTSVTIPSSVTSIGSSAFSSCTSLPSITIPSTVTSIGTTPFSQCVILTSIIVDSNNNGFTNNNDDGNLYSCTKNGGVTTLISLIQYAIGKTETSFTIPNGVTSIGSNAFLSCTSLTNITIPASVTSIVSLAFQNCTSLTNITIPSSVNSIGDQAFLSCTSLTNITIPASVTSIQLGTFQNCTSLTTITIPASVTSIGTVAFLSCTSLTTINIPASVTSFSGNAFGGIPTSPPKALEQAATLNYGSQAVYRQFFNKYGYGFANTINYNSGITFPTNYYIIQSNVVTDLSNVFAPLTGTARSATGFVVNNYNNTGPKDLSQIFEPYTTWTQASITGIKVNGIDLNQIFKPL